MKRTLHLLLLAALASGVALADEVPSDPPTPTAGDTLRFAVVGHLRGNADGELNPWIGKIASAIAADAPQAVVLTGDQIWGSYHAERVERAAVEADWVALEAALAPIGAPLLMVPGNHDINDPVTRDVFRERYGPRPAARRLGNTLLLLLDSTRIDDVVPTPSPRNHTRREALPAPQVRWIEATLAEHRDAEHVFVFVHHALWWEADAAWWREVHPLLARSPVRAVFAGDFGPLKFSHGSRDGIDYIQSAVAGSSHLNTLRAFEASRVMNYQLENFVLVEVQGGEAQLTVRTAAALSTGKTSPDRHREVYAEERSLRERIGRTLGGPTRRIVLAGLALLAFAGGALVGYRAGSRR